MVQFNKGGRPRKLDGEKMKYKVTVKMSTVEYFSLIGKSQEAGITQSEFIRQSIMNTTVVQRLTPELNAEIRKLSGMANNLNQIARKANVLGYDHIRNEYLFLARKIDRIINNML